MPNVNEVAFAPGETMSLPFANTSPLAVSPLIEPAMLYVVAVGGVVVPEEPLSLPEGSEWHPATNKAITSAATPRVNRPIRLTMRCSPDKMSNASSLFADGHERARGSDTPASVSMF